MSIEDSIAEVRRVDEANKAYYQVHGHHSYEDCNCQFRILLERSQCEFWTLDSEGGAADFNDICYDQSHLGWEKYVIMNGHGEVLQDFDEYQDAKEWVEAQEKQEA